MFFVSILDAGETARERPQAAPSVPPLRFPLGQIFSRYFPENMKYYYKLLKRFRVYVNIGRYENQMWEHTWVSVVELVMEKYKVIFLQTRFLH